MIDMVDMVDILGEVPPEELKAIEYVKKTRVITEEDIDKLWSYIRSDFYTMTNSLVGEPLDNNTLQLIDNTIADYLEEVIVHLPENTYQHMYRTLDAGKIMINHGGAQGTTALPLRIPRGILYE